MRSPRKECRPEHLPGPILTRSLVVDEDGLAQPDEVREKVERDGTSLDSVEEIAVAAASDEARWP